MARLLLGAALRSRNELHAARAILEPLSVSQPQMGTVWRELGLLFAQLGENEFAVSALVRCVDLDPFDMEAWFGLGDLLFPAAADTYNPACSDGRIREAAVALRENRLADAEATLREIVRLAPDEPVARKLLGDTLVRSQRWVEARSEFEAALELSSGYTAARFRLATVLFANRRFQDSLPHITHLIESDPGRMVYRAMNAVALGWSWEFERAIAEFDSLLADYPSSPGLWLEYGRVLRAAQRHNSAKAFAKAVELLPSCADAYLALAGMKSFHFDESWIEGIRAQLAREDVAEEDRARLHFVLGKLFEDLSRYRESFEHYESTNEILLNGRRYGAEASTRLKLLAKKLFTPAFFRQRKGTGYQEPGAIFIVGLPRSGSTLLEQILSSHSEIEGLGELDDMSTIVSELAASQKLGPRYPLMVGSLGPDRLRGLGARYMELVKARRNAGGRFFTDKSLSNFAHIGLIQLILPNARIIDMRRHPLDCGFSCYKHYFPFGQPLTYSLEDIGRAYVDYVELMAHFDDVLPGKVHRIIYEQLIENPEEEIRRLLSHLGLPFEEQCLRFHENKRFVKTLSYDQVRMPLYRSGMEQWRHYEPWLGPLKDKLGYVLDAYPEVPKFYAHLNARRRTEMSLGPQSNFFNVMTGVRQFPFETVP